MLTSVRALQTDINSFAGAFHFRMEVNLKKCKLISFHRIWRQIGGNPSTHYAPRRRTVNRYTRDNGWDKDKINHQFMLSKPIKVIFRSQPASDQQSFDQFAPIVVYPTLALFPLPLLLLHQVALVLVQNTLLKLPADYNPLEHGVIPTGVNPKADHGGRVIHVQPATDPRDVGL